MQKKRGRKKEKKEVKKGLSTIVITLIIILISLVAVGVIWIVVRNVVQSGSEQISMSHFSLSAKIMRVNIDNVSNIVSLTVRRNPGQGQFTNLMFVFYDGQNYEVITQPVSLTELEEKRIDVHLDNLSVSNLTTISMVPELNQNGGEIMGDVLDEYNVQTEATTFIPSMPIDSSLMLWLKFEDGLSDNRTMDSSNYNRSVTCAAITCPTYLPAGGVDGSGAYDFDGGVLNQSMTIQTPLVNPSEWTYATWFYPKSNATATSALVGQTNNPALRWITTPTARRAYSFLAWSNPPGYKQQSSPDLALNQWHHAVMIVNLTDPVNQTMYFYVDGVSVAYSYWINGTITRPSGGHYLNIRDAARTFNGSMDNLRIYNRSLSYAEILLLNSTKT